MNACDVSLWLKINFLSYKDKAGIWVVVAMRDLCERRITHPVALEPTERVVSFEIWKVFHLALCLAINEGQDRTLDFPDVMRPGRWKLFGDVKRIF